MYNFQFPNIKKGDNKKLCHQKQAMCCEYLLKIEGSDSDTFSFEDVINSFNSIISPISGWVNLIVL